jgi:hypothetical protein
MRRECYRFIAAERLPQTNSNGLVEIEEKPTEEGGEVKKEIWGTIRGLARVLRVSGFKSTDHRLSECRSRPGKDASGRSVSLYSLQDMRKAFADQLSDLPKTGADGLVEIEEKVSEEVAEGKKKEKWGTIRGLKRALGVSEQALRNRLAQCRFRPGKDATGKLVTLYSLEDARTACADVITRKVSRK